MYSLSKQGKEAENDATRVQSSREGTDDFVTAVVPQDESTRRSGIKAEDSLEAAEEQKGNRREDTDKMTPVISSTKHTNAKTSKKKHHHSHVHSNSRASQPNDESESSPTQSVINQGVALEPSTEAIIQTSSSALQPSEEFVQSVIDKAILKPSAISKHEKRKSAQTQPKASENIASNGEGEVVRDIITMKTPRGKIQAASLADRSSSQSGPNMPENRSASVRRHTSDGLVSYKCIREISTHGWSPSHQLFSDLP